MLTRPHPQPARPAGGNPGLGRDAGRAAGANSGLAAAIRGRGRRRPNWRLRLAFAG